jgi:tetratricopeptide (TPR) repeat protein
MNDYPTRATVSAAQEIEDTLKEAAQLAQNKQVDAAVTLLKQIDPMAPMAPEIHLNLGLLYGKCLLDDLAINEYWEDHTDEEILFEYALTHFKKALDIDPELTMALNNMARICAVKGHTDEAREYYRQSLEIDPDQVKVLDDLETLD